jgi:hypothetical protein
MKPTASFSTTASAGILLALVLTTGAARSFTCVGCELATSYHAAVRVYDKARAWSLIVQWWIDPEYAPAVRSQQPPLKPAPVKPENVCEMRSTSITAK